MGVSTSERENWREDKLGNNVLFTSLLSSRMII